MSVSPFLFFVIKHCLSKKNTITMESKNLTTEEVLLEIISIMKELTEILESTHLAERDWVTDLELCKGLNMSKQTIDRYCESGELKHVKLGQNIFFLVSDVDEFMETRMVSKQARGKQANATNKMLN